MSKGLEALKKFAHRLGEAKVDENGEIYNSLGDMYEPYKTIEKELKALEIIMKKNIDTELLNNCHSVCEYNARFPAIREKYQLTQEEFGLLKEVLEND